MQTRSRRSAPEDDSVPSVFDEDLDAVREQRQRELRRLRSVLISSGFLILLPPLISRLRTGGLEGLAEAGFAIYALAVLACYVLLGVFATRKPLTALLVGIGVYVLLQAWIVWSAPASLYAGWIFRILVLLNLCMPLQRAKALQNGS